MMHTAFQKSGMRRKLLITVVAMIAISGSVAFGFENAPRTTATQIQGDPNLGPEFKYEVASIKPSGPTSRWYGRDLPDGIIRDAITVMQLFQQSYAAGDMVRENQVFGAPGWLRTQRFDIQAKMSDSVEAKLQKLSESQQNSARSQMLRELLTDRFKLKVHQEIRQLPVYYMIVSNSGAKLTKTAPGREETTEINGKVVSVNIDRTERGVMKCYDVNMVGWAGFLTRWMGRPVLDKTGLEGGYNFTLHWAPTAADIANLRGADVTDSFTPPRQQGESSGQPAFAASTPSGFSTLPDALERELGLKLKPGQGPVKVWVFDHVEEPSGN